MWRAAWAAAAGMSRAGGGDGSDCEVLEGVVACRGHEHPSPAWVAVAVRFPYVKPCKAPAGRRGTCSRWVATVFGCVCIKRGEGMASGKLGIRWSARCGAPASFGRGRLGARRFLALHSRGSRTTQCTSSMSATVVLASGAAGVQHASRRGKPKVDCFYVYPIPVSGPARA